LRIGQPEELLSSPHPSLIDQKPAELCWPRPRLQLTDQPEAWCWLRPKVQPRQMVQ